MTVSSRRVHSFVLFGLLALSLEAAGSAAWGALLYVNVQSTPSVPWALPALAALLWAMWRYLRGDGWPAVTRARRRALLRANPVAPQAFFWTIAAGLLAIAALAGLWIVMFRLVPMQPNLVLPRRFTASPLWIAAMIAGASLLAPIVEESAVRGYLQSVVERDFSPVSAVALSSLVFALMHVTQGPAWPKLLVYFLVGVAFGSLAYLNRSILPVIPVHIAGDLTFFLFIWPYDGARTVVWQAGADAWFWIHVAQIVVFTLLSVAACRKLRGLRHSEAARQLAGPPAAILA